MKEDLEKICMSFFGIPAKQFTEKWVNEKFHPNDFVQKVDCEFETFKLFGLVLEHDWSFDPESWLITVKSDKVCFTFLPDMFARFVQGQLKACEAPKKLSLLMIVDKDKRHLKFGKWYEAVKAWKGEFELGVKKEWQWWTRSYEITGYWFGDLFISPSEKKHFEQFYKQHHGRNL